MVNPFTATVGAQKSKSNTWGSRGCCLNSSPLPSDLTDWGAASPTHHSSGWLVQLASLLWARPISGLWCWNYRPPANRFQTSKLLAPAFVRQGRQPLSHLRSPASLSGRGIMTCESIATYFCVRKCNLKEPGSYHPTVARVPEFEAWESPWISKL